MKKGFRFLGLSLVPFLAGLFVATTTGDPILRMQIQKRHLAKQASIDSKDDPQARERWELRRLVDPATGEIPKGIREKELAYAATLPTKERVLRQAFAKDGTVNAAFTWVKRGPNNVGGRTRAFKADVANANILIAGGISGGLWRSTDDGATWTKTTAPSQLHSITCLAQDVRSGQQSVWYAGTGERSGNSTSGGSALFLGGGIYKSIDNGASWTVLAATASTTPQTFNSAFNFVNNVVVDPSDGEVYAAACNVILKSTNGGTNWTTVRGTLFNNSASDVQVTTAGVVYAAINSARADSGIWRSPDGVTWTSITPAGFPTTYGRIVIGIAPSNQNAVYFLVQGTNGTNGVDQINSHQVWKYTYASGNGSGAGGTWVNKGVSLPNQAGAADNAEFSTQGGYDMTVQVKPDNENFVIIGGVNLYKTADFSVTTPTWTRLGGYATAANYGLYLNHHPDQHSGFFRTGSNVIFYSGHDGGLTKSADVTAGTVAWSVLNNGYTTSQFYTIAIDHGTNGDNVIIGGTQDNGTWWTNTSNSATAWISQFSGDGAYAAVADGRTSYYVSSQNGNTYRWLINASGGFVNYANIQPTGATGYQFINPFTLDPNNTNMMYLSAGNVIWRNTDLTAIPTGNDVTTTVNWTQLTNTNVQANPISALGVSKSSPANRLYFGTNAGDLYRLDSANTGNTTPPTDIGTTLPAGYISCIAVNPSNGDQAMAVYSNYKLESLHYTTNAGVSWTAVSGNLEGNPDAATGNGPSCRWASIVPTTQGTFYFVATSTGLYSTTLLNGSSTTWAQEGATLIGNVVVDMLDYRTSDGLVVAATHGNGVFSATVLTSVPQMLSHQPGTFMLEPNYPNPFNPSTRIRYTLSERGRVRLSIYDESGRQVAVLVDQDHPAGSYETNWNARSNDGTTVSSGVYFARLEQGSLSKTQKLVFIK